METLLEANRDGGTLLRRRWQVENASVALLGVHGISEHSGRYAHVGDHLAAAGIDAEFFDLRGHGQSGGPRGYVESYERFHDDIEDLLAQRRRLELPVVLLGHSLGGLIVASYLLTERPEPDLVVLSAPALGSSHSQLSRLLAKAMNMAAPKLFVPRRTDPSILSRDPQAQDRWRNDPLVLQGTTGALATNSLAEMDHVSANLHRLTLPTYVLHGEADKLVPSTASEPLEAMPNVTYRAWPKFRHECFNELGKEQVLDEMSRWILKKAR